MWRGAGMTDHFTDRSRIETANRCNRQRYWNYHYDGKGIVAAEEGPELTFGKMIHADLEAAFRGQEVTPPITPILDIPVDWYQTMTPDGHTFAEEADALYHGLARTF